MTLAPEHTRTQCPYCGVGCGLIAETRGDRLIAVKGDPSHPVNRGATCRKPLGLPDAVHAADRAVRPLWRDDAEGRFEEVSWRVASSRLARRLRAIAEEHGPDAIAVYVSGQLLTEDYYAAAKLVKGFLGTNNLDSNSRLCMSSAVAGYTGAFGSDGPPAAYEDIDITDCLLLAGTNAAACHPILFSRITARQREGATVIVLDPRRTPTAEAADIHLQLRPGTDLPLLSCLLGLIESGGFVDRLFVERHTEGFEAALAESARWPVERAAAVCGVPEEAIRAAAEAFGRARRAMALWSMGVNQSTVGTLKNRALINLCLVTGNVGRPGCGPLSLTGQPNAMGGRETGGLAQLLPGYRSALDPEHRAEMRRLWALPADTPGVSASPGLASTELTEALGDGRVRAVWVVATNPVVSQPDAARFTAALRRAELLVCQDAYHPTETSALAHVLLPAAQWPEKDGTMTNSERRVGLLRAAIPAPGEALADWEIFARVGRALGFRPHFAWRSAAEVYDEYAAVTAGRPCDVSGLSHARLARGTVQWPAARGPLGAAGTDRLYGSLRFPTPSARARFAPTPHAELADAVSPKFPLILNTGRIANQWHTMTRTAKSPELMAAEPEPFAEVHPADAVAAGIADGELVRLRSAHGQAVVRARLREGVTPGTVFVPFHWGALHVRPGRGALNAIVGRALDPVSKQAELKGTAVRLERVADAVSPAPHARAAGPRHLLVVGSGMAAMAAAEAFRERADPGAWRVTMVGREPHLPYNRMALSKVVAGTIDEPGLTLRDADWLAARGIELRAGTGVASVDVAARIARLDGGDELGYDRLLLATGSRSLVPGIPGLHRRGVHLFRTLDDARAIIADAAPGRRAVVIGGGLLGLEAARGLRARGATVTVVHLAERLMERQLDHSAGILLRRALASLEIEVLLGARTEAVTGGEEVAGVALTDGRVLEAEIVVVAAGIVPEVSLADAAGVEVERGIVVDDELRASVPGVWAVGECAQHRGVVYGLWAPLLEQARVAGASLAGDPAAFHGSVPATTLKVAGVDLFCGGRTSAEEGDEEVISLDTRRGRYRRLLLREERLVGTILLGDLRDAGALREHLTGRTRLPDSLLEAMPPGAEVAVRADAGTDPASLVCTCMSVTAGEIGAAIASGCATVEAVANATCAGTGCGTCRTDIAALIASVSEAADAAELPAAA